MILFLVFIPLLVNSRIAPFAFFSTASLSYALYQTAETCGKALFGLSHFRLQVSMHQNVDFHVGMLLHFLKTL